MVDPAGLIGRTLGRYVLEERLGGGGFGAVYRGRHRTLDQYFAIKVMSPHLTTDDRFVQLFYREARLAAGLRHPNIVQIYDVADEAGLHFIVMELLEGRSLREVIGHDAPVGPDRVSSLMHQLAAALDYAHARSVAHRDVKPENAFVGPDDRLTLVDFGIARAADSTHLTITSGIGTPGYMAPELFDAHLARPGGTDHQRAVDADGYALGILAYALLTGSPPFTGTLGQIIAAQLHQPPPSLRVSRPDLSEDLDQVIQRQLSKDPTERFPLMGAFVTALADALQSRAFRSGTATAPDDTPTIPIESSPYDHDDLEIGAQYLEAARYQEAQRSFDRALQRDPQDPIAWFHKARTLEEQDRPNEALEALERALELDADLTDAWWYRGTVLHGLMRYDEALASFERACAIDPEDVDAWRDKGTTLTALGYHEEAVDCFDRALRHAAEDVDAWLGKAESLSQLKRLDEALRAWNSIVRLSPDDAGAWYGHGLTLQHLGKDRDALKSFDDAIRQTPDDSAIWWSKGLSLESLGRTNDALDAYERAVRLDPRTVDAWWARGALLADLERYEEAIADFDQVLALTPDDADVWLAKGDALMALGRLQDAAAAYNEVLRYRSDDGDARERRVIALRALADRGPRM